MKQKLDKELEKLLTIADARAIQSEDELPSTKQELEIENQKEDIRGKKQDREQRRVFAYHIFKFICIYMIVTMMIVLLSGWTIVCFRLDNAVLITLLSTTTANVFGLFVIVTKYLFHTKELLNQKNMS